MKETPEQPTENGSRYRVESISRALGVLAHLDEVGETSVPAIAESARVTENFVASALGALERRGLARRVGADPDKWALGFGWLQLANASRRQIDLREIALPVMRRMRDDVDETIVLSFVRRHRRVNVEFIESTQNVRRVRQVGPEIPLYVGAAGRVLLSGFSEAELLAYLASAAAADGVVINGLDVEAYARQVAVVRETGIAVAEREFSVDVCAVSTPIRDHNGRVVAALSISAPADRFTPSLRQTAERVARIGAREISTLVGFVGGRPAPSSD